MERGRATEKKPTRPKPVPSPGARSSSGFQRPHSGPRTSTRPQDQPAATVPAINTRNGPRHQDKVPATSPGPGHGTGTNPGHQEQLPKHGARSQTRRQDQPLPPGPAPKPRLQDQTTVPGTVPVPRTRPTSQQADPGPALGTRTRTQERRPLAPVQTASAQGPPTGPGQPGPGTGGSR